MAKKKNKKINALIKRFTEELKKEIPVEKILLFGSYAEGNPKIDIDIDLIVVSPFLQKVNILSICNIFSVKLQK